MIRFKHELNLHIVKISEKKLVYLLNFINGMENKIRKTYDQNQAKSPSFRCWVEGDEEQVFKIFSALVTRFRRRSEFKQSRGLWPQSQLNLASRARPNLMLDSNSFFRKAHAWKCSKRRATVINGSGGTRLDNLQSERPVSCSGMLRQRSKPIEKQDK